MVSLDPQQILSAQVVLRSASGTPIRGGVITAAEIAAYLPSADAVSRAATGLEELGFTVGELVGISFPISAPARTFERVFKVRLRRTKTGEVRVRPAASDSTSPQELPLERLPGELSKLLEAVTFTRPPEFGPTNW